ncbi:MAG: choice-of-anchor B family protein [Gemmatimonadota bacterium]|nr:choice-of-anchor B family protein [Gemmatimonadota bacterium]
MNLADDMKTVFGVVFVCFTLAGLSPADVDAQGYGRAVAVAGGEVVVGFPNCGGATGGCVYTYAHDGAEWAETGAIMSPDVSAGDGFGTSLAAAAGRLLVVSANSNDGETGRIHVFSRTADGWAPEGMIVPEGLGEGARLGSVLFNGDLAAVVASLPPEPGALPADDVVLLFRATGDGWVQEAMLESPFRRPSRFGGSLALGDELLVIGASRAGALAGAVFVYEPGSDGWSATGELPNADGPASFFGAAVAVAGDRVLVSAGNPSIHPGRIIAFERDGGQWTESGRVQAPDGAPQDRFGSALATDGATVWVGAAGVGAQQGAIYEMAMDDSGPGSVRKARAGSDGGALGGHLAYGDGVLVAGNPDADGGLGNAVILDGGPGDWSEGSTFFKDVLEIEPVLGGQIDCADGEATVFGCDEVDLVAYVPVSQLGGGRGVRVNDIWGWTDPETNRDYAIVGRTDGTSFVDVTDPPNPFVVGNLPRTEGAPRSSWRDMKVYSDHVFIVADGSPEHGMQVLDLTRLREFDGEPLALTEDAHYDLVSSVHNIVINEETGFAYAVGAGGGGESCGGGLHMIDIRDPKNPTFAGCFADERTGREGTGYSHDAQCVIYRGPDTEHQGKEICFGSNETGLSIADVTDKENPVALSVAEYPNVGYTHQGWLTEDHAWFYMNDELDETGELVSNTRTLIYDVADLDDPILVKEYFSDNTSSDHNLYIVGDVMYQSNYNSGLRVFDISDRENPRPTGFFDTVPGEDFPSMNGSWSNYPFFKSGIVVVTSGGEGFFVVRYRGRRPVS